MNQTAATTNGGDFKGPVLVTGGAGFVGSHVVEALLRQATRVIVLDVVNSETSNASEKQSTLKYLRRVAESQSGSALSLHAVDILDQGQVADILRCESPATCVHSAAYVMDRRSVVSPREFIRNNCEGTVSLLEAIAMTDTVKHLVYISSRSVYGDKRRDEALHPVDERHELKPINIYGTSKVAAESACQVYHRLYGLTMNVCRLFPVYGARGRVDMFPRRLLEKLIADDTLEIFGELDAMRDWLYIDDAVDGILKALRWPLGFEIMNLGSGISTSLSDLITVAEELVGKKLKTAFSPRPSGDARFVGVCDYGKAEKLLDWRPTTGLRQGIAKTLDYMVRKADSGR